VINPESQSKFLRIPVEYGPVSTWHALDIALGQDICSALVTDKLIAGVRIMELATR
jgi:4'-phosphopantetheinyl transferase